MEQQRKGQSAIIFGSISIATIVVLASAIGIVSLRSAQNTQSYQSHLEKEGQTITAISSTGTAFSNVVTATAFSFSQTATAQESYSIAKPGTCSPEGDATWVMNPTNAFSCVSKGLELTSAASSTYVTEAKFFWLGHTIPTSYVLSVDIPQESHACFGMITHQLNINYASYYLYFCPNYDYWVIAKYGDTGGTPTALNEGTLPVAVKAPYHIVVTVAGTAEILSINGYTNEAFDASTQKETDTISLVTQTDYSGNNASAVFSNFTYKPAP